MSLARSITGSRSVVAAAGLSSIRAAMTREIVVLVECLDQRRQHAIGHIDRELHLVALQCLLHDRVPRARRCRFCLCCHCTLRGSLALTLPPTLLTILRAL